MLKLHDWWETKSKKQWILFGVSKCSYFCSLTAIKRKGPPTGVSEALEAQQLNWGVRNLPIAPTIRFEISIDRNAA
jgi:hypothetical protein